MATLQEIINESNTLRKSSRLVEDQAKSLSRICQRLYIRLGRNSNQYKSYKDVTVASQTEYTFPTDCKISNIVNMVIQVETSSTSSEYENYKYLEQDQNNSGNYFTMSNTAGKYYLYEDGEAIADASRDIIINYFPTNTKFDDSDLTVVPDLDTDFHDYLVYMLTAENCACGDDPDTELADYWRREGDEYFQELKYRMDDQLNTAPLQSNEAQEMM
ncbi:MAG: hypothetical protein ACM3O3_05255 [Syntrophothermus sp.]